MSLLSKAYFQGKYNMKDAPFEEKIVLPVNENGRMMLDRDLEIVYYNQLDLPELIYVDYKEYE